MPEHVGQKIQTIAELFAKAERSAGRHQRAIERITELWGQPIAAYVLAAALAAWMAANAVAPRLGFRGLDPPPFAWLQLATSIAALLMTLGILVKQNRAMKLDQQRTQLDLQVNLIAEEKIAKLVSLIEELRRDLPSVKNRKDPLAEAMTEAIDLHAVADELEAFREGAAAPPTGATSPPSREP